MLGRALLRTGRRMFADAKDSFVVRMYTPTKTIFNNSPEVETIIYDSLDGGKGILNSNFMVMQATLNPGIIEVHLKGGSVKKLVHVGGLIQKNPDSSIDCALFEAYEKEDIDWDALKKSDVFGQEPIGDTSSEADYLRKLGTSVREDVVNASGNL